MFWLLSSTHFRVTALQPQNGLLSVREPARQDLPREDPVAGQARVDRGGEAREDQGSRSPRQRLRAPESHRDSLFWSPLPGQLESDGKRECGTRGRVFFKHFGYAMCRHIGGIRYEMTTDEVNQW